MFISPAFASSARGYRGGWLIAPPHNPPVFFLLPLRTTVLHDSLRGSAGAGAEEIAGADSLLRILGSGIVVGSRVFVARMVVAAFFFFLFFLFPSFSGGTLISTFLVPLSLAALFCSPPPLPQITCFPSVPEGTDGGGGWGLRALITLSVICLIIAGSRSKVIGSRPYLSSGQSNRDEEDGTVVCAHFDSRPSRSFLLFSARVLPFDLVLL